MATPKFANFSYEEVVYKYARTVTGVCVMRLKSLVDAEDCFQNTFLKLYTKAPDFKDENHLKAWLIRVAVNECNNFVKRNRRTLYIENIKAEEVIFSEDEFDVSWALMKLPQPYRQVLYLHYCEQYKVAEIAEILGYPCGTVKTWLRRGREKLRAVYGGDEHEEAEF